MEDSTLRLAAVMAEPRSVALSPVILGLDLANVKRNHRSLERDPAYRVLELAVEDTFAELPFKAAFELWLQTHTPFIRSGTLKSYKEYGNPLKEFFGDTRVKEIGHSGVRGYQLWRSRDAEGEQVGYAHNAGNVRIRNEINGVLKPILKEAGCWEEIKSRRFKHLPVPRDGAGTFITPEEQREILGVAFSMPRMKLAGHILMIMARTGCGVGELRKLRRRDVDLANETIIIVLGAKNAGARMRKLTLTSSALDSVRWIVKRWELNGGCDRNDFLLPHRALIKTHTFGQPMSGIYRAWTAIRREWIRRYPGRASRARLRLYDFRVSVAVRLLQNGKLSLATIERALGWTPSSRMVSRYFKPEEQVLRDALNTLEDPPSSPPPV